MLKFETSTIYPSTYCIYFFPYKVELFKESRSSLHFATLEDHLAVMKLLIEAGFEVDRRDISEDTPLTMYAFR